MENSAMALVEANAFTYGGFHKARAHVPNTSGADHTGVGLRAVANYYENDASGREYQPQRVGQPAYAYPAMAAGSALIAHIEAVTGAR